MSSCCLLGRICLYFKSIKHQMDNKRKNLMLQDTIVAVYGWMSHPETFTQWFNSHLLILMTHPVRSHETSFISINCEGHRSQTKHGARRSLYFHMHDSCLIFIVPLKHRLSGHPLKSWHTVAYVKDLRAVQLESVKVDNFKPHRWL